MRILVAEDERDLNRILVEKREAAILWIPVTMEQRPFMF